MMPNATPSRRHRLHRAAACAPHPHARRSPAYPIPFLCHSVGPGRARYHRQRGARRLRGRRAPADRASLVQSHQRAPEESWSSRWSDSSRFTAGVDSTPPYCAAAAAASCTSSVTSSSDGIAPALPRSAAAARAALRRVARRATAASRTRRTCRRSAGGAAHRRHATPRPRPWPRPRAPRNTHAGRRRRRFRRPASAPASHGTPCQAAPG